MALKLPHRAWKLLYLAHYRWLYGRRFPGAGWVARQVRRGEERTGRGDAPQAAARWDEQYRSGRWDFLAGSDELARFGVLVAYLQRLAPGGAVLDVGCGEGVLAELLRPLGYRRFVGVDVAAAAIERAARRADERTTFVAADAERWEPPGRFDAVVLNECVYYFEAPLATVERLARHLAPGGVMLVSAFATLRSRAVLRALRRAFAVRDEVEVAHRKGRWTILVLDPPRGAATTETLPA
jgi:SAM-dependent methyltransferase